MARWIFAWVVTALLAYWSAASPDNHGVDDWNANDIAQFIDNNANIKVNIAALSEMGIFTAEDLVNADRNLLGQVVGEGSAFESKENKVNKLFGAIQKFVVNKKPHDFFEWRYLNKRLCDYYLIPLLSTSPQVLLIWLKYHNRDTDVDEIDNEIDEISDVYYWLGVFFSPSYLCYRANNKFNSSGWIDDILDFFLLLRAALEPIMHISTMFAPPIVVAIIGIIWASFSYYIGYPVVEAIMPWLNDSNFVLYASIYLILPLFIIITIRVVVFKMPEKSHKTESE